VPSASVMLVRRRPGSYSGGSSTHVAVRARFRAMPRVLLPITRAWARLTSSGL
jgi:hypothetical protein